MKKPMTNLNITQEKQLLIDLADSMAAAATTFSGQGYGAFLESREKLIEEISRVEKFLEVK